MQCKSNEAVAYATDEIAKKFEELNIVPVIADKTRTTPVIDEFLHAFGRAGIPYYVAIPGAEGTPVIELPEVLVGPGKILEAVEKASGASAGSAGGGAVAQASSAP